MNRVVVSVPRVLDSAMVVTQDTQLQIPLGTVPATAVPPFAVNSVQATATETQMTNITTNPLDSSGRCACVTATVTIPLTVELTDINNFQFTTYTSVTKNISVILYIPEASSFPYTVSAEGALGLNSATATTDTLTMDHATIKTLVRVTAVSDLLIPSYGYAPVNNVDSDQYSPSRDFLNQPLFPRGKIY